jgi:uncharacterized protein (UPF0212 family)
MSIAIYICDNDGAWVLVTQGVQNQNGAIRVAMAEIQKRFNAEKVKAIDHRTGATVQIMGYPGQMESGHR